MTSRYSKARSAPRRSSSTPSTPCSPPGKQIVLSSDRPPEALSRLAERLRDRFSWGLRVELEQPDLRTRIALLWRLAGDEGRVGAEPAVLHEIAIRAPGNVRLLEGAMTRVLAIASCSASRSRPRSCTARSVPSRRRRSPRRPAPSLEAIQDAVCAVHGLSREELVSPRRAAPVARARQQAMYLARELTPLSLAEIARGFNRDHSTVLHATRAVAERLEPGSETAESIHKTRTRWARGRGRSATVHRSGASSTRRGALIDPTYGRIMRSRPIHPQSSTTQIHLIQIGR